ncbi:hypothetical protein E2C01_093526 [Portunus trituberculatus]|uniref:Uncharacterized protein n=1 Tax=Portunus trituberculatus TaxID=210409 RepID=A0A5B7JQ13_PORTR|nr:hypothetical protein [Portunus trituberculatus]
MEAAAGRVMEPTAPPALRLSAAQWSMSLNQETLTAQIDQSWATDLPDAGITVRHAVKETW